jgi:hypothetical protein
MTAVNGTFGYGLSRSRNVGCEREFTANLADATTPQTVALSPTWLAASPGARVAALVEIAQRLSTVDALMSLAGFNSVASQMAIGPLAD